jgi:hypothetical protein
MNTRLKSVMTVPLLLLCLLGADAPQFPILPGILQTGSAASGPVPTFVNETAGNSTYSTGTVGPLASGTGSGVHCAAYTDCVPLPEKALSGNLTIYPYAYSHSASVTTTATDDKGDSCGTIAGSGDTSTIWQGIAYCPNTTAGAHVGQITFGTTSVTNEQSDAWQFYNIAASVPVDASTSCNGSSSTTANCASLTTNFANDLIFVFVCRAGTPATNEYTPGTGYTIRFTQIIDGCAVEYGVDGSTGSITPTMGLGSSATTYKEQVVAFKAAAAGTAPTGWYLADLLSYSTQESYTGSINYQVASQGDDLLAETNSCNVLTVSGISDSVNTWTTNTAVAVGGNNVNESYVINANPNTTGLLTVSTTGSSGDCTQHFYGWMGAPTSGMLMARSNWSDHGDNSLGFSSGTETLYTSSFYDTVGGSVDPLGTSLPIPSNGVTIAAGSQTFSTSTGLVSPGACLFDASVQGGENLSGPWYRDQNNAFLHCNTGGTPVSSNIEVSQTSTSQNPNGFGLDALSFTSTGIVLLHTANADPTSGSSYTLTVPATTAGNLSEVAIQAYNNPARTVSSVTLGGSSMTCPSAATEAGSSTVGMTTVCYLNSDPSGATSLVVTMSGSISNLDIEYWEWQKASGGTWTFDVAGATAGTGSGNTVTSPSVTIAGMDVCAAVVAVQGSGLQNAVPLPGNPFVYGGYIFSADRQGTASGLIASGTAQANWNDQTSGDGYNSSILCDR